MCICFLCYNITYLFHINLCQTPTPNTLEYCFILQRTLLYFRRVSSALTQVYQYCCTLHLVTLVYCCVVLYHIIIVFTSCFILYVVDTGYGGDMLSLWSDDDNLLILNVGVLLLFFDLGGMCQV